MYHPLFVIGDQTMRVREFRDAECAKPPLSDSHDRGVDAPDQHHGLGP